ncbi:MAG TPA: DUF2782 domain-containing protein [Lysobacter sp.]|nr:DUF2782 domain-containing protein [Lysobacter sp.]
MRPARLFACCAALLLAACASAPAPRDPTAELTDAQVSTRTMENGDVVEEYRVAGQLRVVKVTPPRGPTYYLIDRNGDGRLDESEGEGPVSPVYFKLFEW